MKFRDGSCYKDCVQKNNTENNYYTSRLLRKILTFRGILAGLWLELRWAEFLGDADGNLVEFLKKCYPMLDFTENSLEIHAGCLLTTLLTFRKKVHEFSQKNLFNP